MMKHLFAIVILQLLGSILTAQTQIDIQGNAESIDTVAKIKVNYSGTSEVVGLSVYSVPNGKYSIRGTGGYFYGGRFGMKGKSTVGTGVSGISEDYYGVSGRSESYYGVYGSSASNVGVYGYSSSNYGVYGYSPSGDGVYGGSYAGFGLYGISTESYGVKGESASSRGVYGYSGSNIGVYGQGGSSDFWAHNGTYGNDSSIRWKSNINNIPDAINKLARLRGVYFDWDEDHGGKHAVGFIAEEVGEVLPEVVFYEENGVDAKGMDYSKMTPLLVEAANAMRAEYQEKFDAQESRIAVLETELKELKAMLQSHLIKGELSKN